MASYIFLTLDTTAPGSLTLAVGQGQAQVSVSAQTLHIGCGDTDKTGYQMKIWGDITAAATEAAASWESYAAEKQVVLSSGDGLKTIYVKVRDDVYNESAQVSASVALNTAVPTVTVTGPDNSHISKDTVRNQAVVSFMADADFTEYTVRSVPNIDSDHTAGMQLGELGGTGSFEANKAISVTITGGNLYEASAFATSSGENQRHTVKVFVKTPAGVWSI